MKNPASRKFKIPNKIRDGHTLMLRTCIRDESGLLTSYDGFTWPDLGPVESPQPHADFPLRHWDSKPECGNGLHGFLRGVGDGSLAEWSEKGVWLVVEVKSNEVVDLKGKIKVPRGCVIFSGERQQALELMARLGHLDVGHVGGTSTSGYGGTSTSGYGGTSTSGDRGTSTSGYGGTSTSGDLGTSTSGDGGTSTSGYGGTSTSGDGGTSTSGDRGTSTSGYGGTSTSGDRGTSTSGDGGTSTSGDRGTSTSGYGGIVTAGRLGTIQIKWWDGNRHRISIAYVGEDGITAGSKYMLDEAGKFILFQQVE